MADLSNAVKDAVLLAWTRAHQERVDDLEKVYSIARAAINAHEAGGTGTPPNIAAILPAYDVLAESPAPINGVGWLPINTAPRKEHEKFLVFDGVGVWAAWRCNGEVWGYEVDGYYCPSDNCPPTHWMPLPNPPHPPMD